MKTRLTLSAFLLLLAAAPLHAQTWSNNGTDWGATTNWTGGVVPNSTTANATFNGTITYQPDIGASNYTITGLNVGSASSNVTLGGSTGNLTFTSTTSSTVIDVAANKSLTLGANITFDSALTGTQWLPKITANAGSVIEFASGSTLTSKIGSGNATSIAYALQGSGTYNFNGAFVASNTTTIANKGNGTINWNPSSTSGTINIQQSGTAGSQFNLYKSAGTITFGSAGSGTRTITIKADALTFGTTTMWNATDAGTNPYKNVLAIDDGTASAISVSLTNLTLTSNSSLGTNELFVGANDSMTFTGNITRGAGTTATTLTKSGAGTLVFSGNNTTSYTDATVVSAGTLLLSGNRSMTGTSGVTVAAGATFTNNSSASFTKNLTLTEGAGAAGSVINGSGTFAAGNMTISSDLSDDFTTFALGSATLTKGGLLALTLSGITNGDYTLFSGGTIGGAFTGLSINGFGLTKSGNNFSGSTGGKDYTFTNTTNLLNVIPEPTTWVLLAISLTVVTILRRRRQS